MSWTIPGSKQSKTLFARTQVQIYFQGLDAVAHEVWSTAALPESSQLMFFLLLAHLHAANRSRQVPTTSVTPCAAFFFFYEPHLADYSSSKDNYLFYCWHTRPLVAQDTHTLYCFAFSYLRSGHAIQCNTCNEHKRVCPSACVGVCSSTI